MPVADIDYGERVTQDRIRKMRGNDLLRSFDYGMDAEYEFGLSFLNGPAGVLAVPVWHLQ